MGGLSHFVRLTLLFMLVTGCKVEQCESLRVSYKPEWNLFSVNELDSAMASLALNHIDKVNWEAYPYAPEVAFSIARNDSLILVRYVVDEDYVYAQNLDDMGWVWQDDCVEFFCQIPGDERYFNFETNCLGTLYGSSQLNATKDGRTEFSTDELKQIVRLSSIPRKTLNSSEINHWTLLVGIPYSILQLDPENLPKYIKGNFYKCGDNTPVPHFLSWNQINLPNPQFHAPEFFGKIYFK